MKINKALLIKKIEAQIAANAVEAEKAFAAQHAQELKYAEDSIRRAQDGVKNIIKHNADSLKNAKLYVKIKEKELADIKKKGPKKGDPWRNRELRSVLTILSLVDGDSIAVTQVPGLKSVLSVL